MSQSFSELGLDPQLITALEAIAFHSPTTIQSDVIPIALEGHDLLASAPTGTGKTAAFSLPALQHLLDFPRKKGGPARILILTPTRELALQVTEQIKSIAQHTHLKVVSITGGEAYQDQADVLAKTQDIVVATPGRLMEYINANRFDCHAIEWFILDEADRMLDMGFAPIVEKISKKCQNRQQTLLFSATIDSKGVELFSQNLLSDPKTIQADPSRRERKKIQQWYHRCDNLEHKMSLLKYILEQEEQRCLIFIKTRERLAMLRDRLDSYGINCTWIQGEMLQSRRNNALRRFMDKEINILLATDVAARGIDLPDITHVINFDMPRQADVYLHRIGRTARAGKKGSAISLIEAHDQPMIERVSRYMKESIKERYIEGLRPAHKKAVFNKKKKK